MRTRCLHASSMDNRPVSLCITKGHDKFVKRECLKVGARNGLACNLVLTVERLTMHRGTSHVQSMRQTVLSSLPHDPNYATEKIRRGDATCFRVALAVACAAPQGLSSADNLDHIQIAVTAAAPFGLCVYGYQDKHSAVAARLRQASTVTQGRLRS
jgi:hypothetical protein